MNLEALTSAHEWHVAGWVMLHYTWIGGLIGLAALAARVGTSRASATVRHGAALTCFALLTVAPVAMIPLAPVVEDSSPAGDAGPRPPDDAAGLSLTPSASAGPEAAR